VVAGKEGGNKVLVLIVIFLLLYVWSYLLYFSHEEGHHYRLKRLGFAGEDSFIGCRPFAKKIYDDIVFSVPRRDGGSRVQLGFNLLAGGHTDEPPLSVNEERAMLIGGPLWEGLILGFSIGVFALVGVLAHQVWALELAGLGVVIGFSSAVSKFLEAFFIPGSDFYRLRMLRRSSP
jgi:hypothetical protein